MDIKEKIYNMYEEVFNGSNAEAAAKYLSVDYKQHNPGVPQGRAGFIKAFGDAFKSGKKMNLKVLKVVEGEGLVAVLIARGNEPDKLGLMDIYRVNDDGMFCEHWDVFNRK